MEKTGNSKCPHEIGRSFDALPWNPAAILRTSIQLSFDICVPRMYERFYAMLSDGSASVLRIHFSNVAYAQTGQLALSVASRDKATFSRRERHLRTGIDYLVVER